jgi:hypothetical protein
MPNEVRKLTHEEKIAAFKATASDYNRRSEYAQSRATVLMPQIAAQSTIRAIFQPELLPPGAEPRYDIPFDDIECVWSLPQIGGIPQTQVEGTEIYVTTFGVHAAVQYQMNVAKQGRYNIGERATTMLKNKIIEQEELAGWTLIKAHAAVLPDEQKVACPSGLTVDAFNAVTTAGDILRRTINNLYVSPQRFGDMRKWVNAENYSQQMKDQSFSAAGLKNVWGVNIHTVYDKNLVPNDKGYAFGSREGYTYGVMPIREQLQTFDNPIAIMEWKIGIMARQELGFGILDDKGLYEMDFTATP